ncbi:tannase/feruloyl esterase family alpha/beta hydrolase [Isoptericola haloaureus]|uniref:Tannase/feruloyl esterase family alpha/beta hydrolase n=1 Tax=Isoptericola haloaureus TaxID=1542902 RepID=A0ABU7Z4J3_9MICO
MTNHPRSRLRRGARLVAALAAMLALAAPLAPATATDDAGTVDVTLAAADCTAMAGTTITAPDDAEESGTLSAVVETAEVVDGSCALSGTAGGTVGFTLQLPLEDWNGRYFQTGCGGFCGYVPIADCAEPLADGFAVGAENTGHVGSSADAFLDDAQAEADWGYRSPHVLAVVAKATLAELYGTPPSTSYFMGCSTGGRQALSEAQRYPEDFDGIVAGAPALYQNYLAVLSQGHFETVNRDADGGLILDTTDVGLVSDAVLASCDLDDGRADGVVGDPLSCAFDPATLLCADGGDGTDCLTATQVETLEALYSAPTTDDGELLYPDGLAVGSEAGWPFMTVATSEGSMSISGDYAQNVLRYLAFPEDPGVAYSLGDFDPSTEADLLHTQAAVYNADDVDLSAFRERGGKLILWHGWADPLITPYGTLDYYERVVDADGGARVTDSYLRTFMLPGVYHCSGGPGQDEVDWMSAISAWVEDDVAPESVTATGNGATRVVERYEAGGVETVDWIGAPQAPAPGASGDAPGRTGQNPGHGGTAPGRAGTAPGLTVTAAGRHDG